MPNCPAEAMKRFFTASRLFTLLLVTAVTIAIVATFNGPYLGRAMFSIFRFYAVAGVIAGCFRFGKLSYDPKGAGNPWWLYLGFIWTAGWFILTYLGEEQPQRSFTTADALKVGFIGCLPYLLGLLTAKEEEERKTPKTDNSEIH